MTSFLRATARRTERGERCAGLNGDILKIRRVDADGFLDHAESEEQFEEEKNANEVNLEVHSGSEAEEEGCVKNLDARAARRTACIAPRNWVTISGSTARVRSRMRAALAASTSLGFL